MHVLKFEDWDQKIPKMKDDPNIKINKKDFKIFIKSVESEIKKLLEEVYNLDDVSKYIKYFFTDKNCIDFLKVSHKNYSIPKITAQELLNNNKSKFDFI